MKTHLKGLKGPFDALVMGNNQMTESICTLLVYLVIIINAFGLVHPIMGMAQLILLLTFGRYDLDLSEGIMSINCGFQFSKNRNLSEMLFQYQN